MIWGNRVPLCRLCVILGAASWTLAFVALPSTTRYGNTQFISKGAQFRSNAIRCRTCAWTQPRMAWGSGGGSGAGGKGEARSAMGSIPSWVQESWRQIQESTTPKQVGGDGRREVIIGGTGEDGGRGGRGRGGGGGGDDGQGGGGYQGREVVLYGNVTVDDTMYTLDGGVEVDESLVRQSPLVRTVSPLWSFLRSRTGLYGMMVGYVIFSLKQHILPVYLSTSLLSIITPTLSRRLVVLATQGFSALILASYIQDQFRNQVFPLPPVKQGPSAPYAVVTGATSGIGKEIALELAERGYNLLLVARTKENLQKTAKEIRQASRDAIAVEKAEMEKGELQGLNGDGAGVGVGGLAGTGTYHRQRRRSATRDQRDWLSSNRGSRRRRRGRTRRQRRRERWDREDGQEPTLGLALPKDRNVKDTNDQPLDEDKSSNLEGKGGGQKDQEDQKDTHAHVRAQEGPWESWEAAKGGGKVKAVQVKWVQADLSNATGPDTVYEEVKRLDLSVDVLVNAAGVCWVSKLHKLDKDHMEAQIGLNVMGTTRLTQLFARDFALQRRGRILMVSSATAAAPNPRVAVYAASKAYISSFSEALHSELEVYGVGVTCSMPGATRTDFIEASNSSSALVWRLPLVSMEADEVAAQSVEAMLRGDRLVIPGWPNKLHVHVFAALLPRKILMTLVERIWQ